MPYLTISELANAGISLPANGFSVSYIETVLSVWEQQIDQYIGTQFTITDKNVDYRINQCQDTYLHIGSWQVDGLHIQLLNRYKQVVKILQLDTDYHLVFSFDKKCVIGLDFRCLSCLCDCQYIRVTGSWGWSDTVPGTVKLLLINLVRLLISTNQSNSNLGLPVIVDNEKSRNLSRSMFVSDTAKSAMRLASGAQITSLLEVCQVLLPYRVNYHWQEVNI